MSSAFAATKRIISETKKNVNNPHRKHIIHQKYSATKANFSSALQTQKGKKAFLQNDSPHLHRHRKAVYSYK